MTLRQQLEEKEKQYGNNFRNVDWYAYTELQHMRHGWVDDEGNDLVAFV